MPGQFIESFLNEHFQAFSQRDLTGENLCALREFSFEGTGPDYANPILRELYYLRYSSAYITEYYLAYRRIFSQHFLRDGGEVTVLSLGCGAMLDLIGFEYARKNTRQFSEATPIYQGVDIVDWQCQSTKIIDDIVFCGSGIEAFSPADTPCMYDIIIFPKSVSDIDSKLIINFAEQLARDDLLSKICIINSKRGASIDDSSRAESFCKILCQKFGYEMYTETFKLEENEHFEDLLENKFEFNNDIGYFLRNLTSPCLFSDCGQIEECQNIFGKWPMRYARNIQPEIYYLEK